jgi:hypothetical protein
MIRSFRRWWVRVVESHKNDCEKQEIRLDVLQTQEVFGNACIVKYITWIMNDGVILYFWRHEVGGVLAACRYVINPFLTTCDARVQ